MLDQHSYPKWRHFFDLSLTRLTPKEERYLKQKEAIRSKTKKTLRDLSELQKQQILEQGRKEGRQEIAKKLVDSSDTQPVNVI